MKNKGFFCIAFGFLTIVYSLILGYLSGITEFQFVTGLLGGSCFSIGISFTMFDFSTIKRKKYAKLILLLGISVVLFSILILVLSVSFWPIIFSIGFFVLVFIYLPLLTKNRIEKWKRYTRKPWHAFLLSMGDLFSFSSLILGILFKIMQWPYAGILLSIGIALLSITLVSWNRLFSQEIVLRKETEEKVKEALKDITDSITYAKRIQQAKLPSKELIYSALPDSFVLFKPKDIVSGDFYYFHKNDKAVFIASADCTGHGVPGAFMSMIGSEKLDDALTHSADTSEILRHLNKGIKISLHQTDSNESTRDGMDIALCSIDTDARIVKYAGANRPIWIIRNRQIEIEAIKATKAAIGGLTEYDQKFETHTIQLHQGDTFYIFSDGYADQDGGDKGKRLMTKPFKQLLLDIQTKSMQEQEKHLDQFIDNWRGKKEQLDDILIIGVRL